MILDMCGVSNMCDSEYARSTFYRVLNKPPVLNMPGPRIWQGCQYARVTQGAEYASISLTMP